MLSNFVSPDIANTLGIGFIKMGGMRAILQNTDSGLNEGSG